MIQLTKEKLDQYDQRTIGELAELAAPALRHRQACWRRVIRKYDPNTFMGNNETEERVIIPFEYYIVKMFSGYVGGKAPMYNVAPPSDTNIYPTGILGRINKRLGTGKAIDRKKQEYIKEYQAQISRIQKYNDDASLFFQVVKSYAATNAAFLYIFQEENTQEIRYVLFDSQQTESICDESTPPQLIGAVRTWVNSDKRQVIEKITAERYQQYIQGKTGFELEKDEPLAWGDAPIVAFENPDCVTVFEPSLGEIEAYEESENNVKNMTQYNDSDAKLLISGYSDPLPPMTQETETGEYRKSPEREAFEKALIKARTLFVGQDGDIRWLLKDISYDGILAVQARRHDNITMLSGVPNMTDEAFSNADNASALGYKLYAMDQYAADLDRELKKGYLRLWEIITNRLNLIDKRYNFRDIQITLQRNIPTDKDKSIARGISLFKSGAVSQETAINEMQIEVDAKDEIKRVKAEKDAEYSEAIQRGEQQEMPMTNSETDPESGRGNDRSNVQ